MTSKTGTTPAIATPGPKERDRLLYRELKMRLTEAGCFRPAPIAYGVKIALLLAAGTGGYVMLLSGPDFMARAGLTALMAFISVQAGFIAHDAGDGAVTPNRRASFLIRHSLMSFVAALSSTYFDYLHRVHHLTVSRGARGLGKNGLNANPYEVRWFKRSVSWNGLVFMIVTSFLRGVTFRLESLRYLWRNPRTTKPDRFFMGTHAVAWLAVPIPFIGLADTAINYMLVALLAGPYVGTVLILNHEGMSQAGSLGHLSLIERVTRTTRNLGSSRLSDLLFGGINNHIEHHLFPQIPAIRLRQARTITRDFCREHGVTYVETSFVRAVFTSARHFRTSSRERLVAEALS